MHVSQGIYPIVSRGKFRKISNYLLGNPSGNQPQNYCRVKIVFFIFPSIVNDLDALSGDDNLRRLTNRSTTGA